MACGTGGFLRGISDKGPDLQHWSDVFTSLLSSTSKFSSTYVMSRDEILAAINADNRNWLNAPWVVAEFYFYRRIVEAFKFFETGYDMFAKQKQVHAM